MRKFWEWMKEKRYLLVIEGKCMPWDSTCFLNSSKTLVIEEVDNKETEMTNQMLGFYMIEYLFEKYPECLNRPAFWDLFRGENKSASNIFNWLKTKIQKIEEK